MKLLSTILTIVVLVTAGTCFLCAASAVGDLAFIRPVTDDLKSAYFFALLLAFIVPVWGFVLFVERRYR